ncbi:GNAT family N-acetyltransferase [Salinicola aestuarinus]|uniref:GNAT family N-acetyltransferase n=1 Tax=Salinicola aestuarinus TaxID=1949082 RepID=UPI001300A86F|nr:GNAT family N-acetyltransferase [Salinicola aestuarinus]
MAELEWRAALPPDLATVSGWVESATALERWAGPGVDWPLEADRLWQAIGAGTLLSYCLKREGAPLAFGQLSPRAPHHYHLARLIVAPTERGQGLGRRLCEGLINEGRQRGAMRFTLNVFTDNAPAVALYRQLGFRRAGECDARGVVPMRLTLFAEPSDNPDNDARADSLPDSHG